MSKLVDDQTLVEWRELDTLYVLKRLGCYAKRDISFHPIKAKGTVRYHVNANAHDWELLIAGPKFWDARANKGGGGAIDLAMHLFNLDFKHAVRMLRAALSEVTAISRGGLPHDGTGRSLTNFTGLSDGEA
ncbi:hypothetical protein [Cupriavidus pinatubonensis]|uniref:Uncharacterized protein n=1 Tax=Cupriavidus pinatubonensis TaxID=248026 RepID=A0ABM8WTM1_9BURK|nr:hypothetical protein [Cupriavidus pinatubonensis]CAG9170825.1 hypothetical protein LMG23994_02016 [Cupriavidus pinatubonensis]